MKHQPKFDTYFLILKLAASKMSSAAPILLSNGAKRLVNQGPFRKKLATVFRVFNVNYLIRYVAYSGAPSYFGARTTIFIQFAMQFQ